MECSRLGQFNIPTDDQQPIEYGKMAHSHAGYQGRKCMKISNVFKSRQNASQALTAQLHSVFNASPAERHICCTDTRAIDLQPNAACVQPQRTSLYKQQKRNSALSPPASTFDLCSENSPTSSTGPAATPCPDVDANLLHSSNTLARDDPYNRCLPEPGLTDCSTAPLESLMLSARASSLSGQHSHWGDPSSKTASTLIQALGASPSSQLQRSDFAPSRVLGSPAARLVQLVRANVHLVPSKEPYSSYEVAALHTSLTEGANLRRDSSADELLSVASGVDAAASGPNLTHILYQNMQVWTGPMLKDVEAARKLANIPIKVHTCHKGSWLGRSGCRG
jgi:hypothetical protein